MYCKWCVLEFTPDIVPLSWSKSKVLCSAPNYFELNVQYVTLKSSQWLKWI